MAKKKFSKRDRDHAAIILSALATEHAQIDAGRPASGFCADDIAAAIGASQDAEMLFRAARDALLALHVRLTLTDEELIAVLEREDAETTAPVIDLDARRQERDLAAQLAASLALSGHRCGLCKKPWGDHDGAAQIAEHAAELRELGKRTDPQPPQGAS